MQHVELEIESDYFRTKELAEMFFAAFPKRSISYFRTILKRAADSRAPVVIFKLGEARIGACILFEVIGYRAKVFAPSYFFISEKFRFATLKAHNLLTRHFDSKIINLTPSDSMMVLLRASRYQQWTHGSSLVIPRVRIIGTSFRRVRTLYESKLLFEDSVFAQWRNRDDICWYCRDRDDSTHLLGVKRFRFLGFPLRLVVYSRGIPLERLQSLIRENHYGLPTVPVLVPNVGGKMIPGAPWAKKFRVHASFEGDPTMYSVLGSEMTELI